MKLHWTQECWYCRIARWGEMWGEAVSDCTLLAVEGQLRKRTDMMDWLQGSQGTTSHGNAIGLVAMSPCPDVQTLELVAVDKTRGC